MSPNPSSRLLPLSAEAELPAQPLACTLETALDFGEDAVREDGASAPVPDRWVGRGLISADDSGSALLLPLVNQLRAGLPACLYADLPPLGFDGAPCGAGAGMGGNEASSRRTWL